MPVTDGARPEPYWMSTIRARALHDYLDSRTPTAVLRYAARHWPTRDRDRPFTIHPLQQVLDDDPDGEDRHRHRRTGPRRRQGTADPPRATRLVPPSSRGLLRRQRLNQGPP